MHDPDYRQSWKDWESFVEALTEKISELDETIPELPPKDLVSNAHSDRTLERELNHWFQVFRIYRDIRFSSDPTPYKVYVFSVLFPMFFVLFVPLTPSIASFLCRLVCLCVPYSPLKVRTDMERSRTGRKGPYACYYVQIQPGGKSLVGMTCATLGEKRC